MKLHIPLALTLLLVSFASASAKDDITKELMQVERKDTRLLSLRAFDRQRHQRR